MSMRRMSGEPQIGVLAGTGAALLAIGAAKRRPASLAVAVQRGRLVLEQRVRF